MIKELIDVMIKGIKVAAAFIGIVLLSGLVLLALIYLLLVLVGVNGF